MKTFIKKLTLKLTAKVFDLFLLNEESLSVFCFHAVGQGKDKYSVSEKTFKSTVLTLMRDFQFVSVNSVLIKNRLKKKQAILTFDDGYKGILNVSDFLKKHKISPTLFVMSDLNNIDRDELGNNEKLLSVQEIKKLHRAGWTIGCHSATHTDFSNLSNKEIKKEIIQSKKDLEKALGFKIKYFAYPKGYSSAKILTAVKKAGYSAAFCANSGIITKNENRFTLPRFVMEKKEIFTTPFSFLYSTHVLRTLKETIYGN